MSLARSPAFWMILLLALVVRVGDMFWHPLGPDEGFTLDLATGSWTELVARTAADTHPPFYYALVKVWFALVGAGLFRAKLLSILFSLATLVLLFHLARDLFGRRAAWLALLSSAFLPYQVYYSHTARMHLVQPFFITTVIFLSYRYLARERKRDWVLAAAAWALAIQTNYMGLVFGPVWGAAFLLAEPAPWRRRLKLALAPLPGLLLFLPWLSVLRAHQESSPMTIPFFQDAISPGSLYYHSVFGAMTYIQGDQPFAFLLPAGLLFSIVLVCGAGAAGRRWSIWVLLIGMPSLPIAIALLRDLTLAERHLLFSIPFFMAYWGAGLDRCARTLADRWRRRRGLPVPDQLTDAERIPTSGPPA